MTVADRAGMYSRRNLLPSARGFSLIELVVVIVVMGIIAAVGANILGEAFQAYFLGKDTVVADAQARLAIERMTRELRDIRSATAADIPTLTAGSIRFIDVYGNDITYALLGTTLNRTTQPLNTNPLADNISALAFTYLTKDGQTSAATAATVYYITVTFTVTKSTLSLKYRGTVKPRSF